MKILFFTLFSFVLSSVFTQTSATYFPVKENETWCFYDTVAKNVNPSTDQVVSDDATDTKA